MQRPSMAAAAARVVIVTSAAAVLACSGAPIEERPGSPRWGDVRLVEDLRIGRYDGPEEYLFGNIGDIVQHPDGTVFISDIQVPMIRRYDAEGRYLHDIGRQGQGPGEYEGIVSLRLMPDGNLAIWDARLRRVTVVRPDGTFVHSFTADSGLQTSSRVTLQVDHESNFYVLTTVPAPDDPQERLDAYLKYAPDGTLLDTVQMPDRTPETPGWVLSTRQGLLPNFARRTASTITRSGHVVAGDNGSYSFQVLDGDEVMISVAREWEPVALHPEEHALWSDRQDRIQNRPPPSGFVNPPEPPTYAPIPETKPAFMDIWPGEDDTIWVRRYAQAHRRTDLPPRDPDDDRPLFDWWQYPTWDVFGPEGEFLGTVELPHDTQVLWYHGEVIWTVQPDEQDEDVAVRYRIEKSGAGDP